MDFTYNPYKYSYKSLEQEMGFKEQSIRSSLERMEKRGVIERAKTEAGEQVLQLTNQGMKEFLRNKLKSATPTKKGSLVVVIFDIPELSRTVRDTLRRNLKEFGFKPWQKSVWVSEKDIFDLINDYFKNINLKGQVIVFESSRSSIDNSFLSRS